MFITWSYHRSNFYEYIRPNLCIILLQFLLIIYIFIIYCRHLLQSEEIIVSYCAAEIIAHLACESSWEIYGIKDNKDEVLNQLGLAIKQWTPQEVEFVVFKSFNCFIGLLNSTDIPEVQLFATWAIHHACTTNSQYILFINLIEISV